MEETIVKTSWNCELCKRSFKRETYYLKHLARKSCTTEKDAILALVSQPPSPRLTPTGTDIRTKEIIVWFDQQIELLRKQLILFLTEPKHDSTMV